MAIYDKNHMRVPSAASKRKLGEIKGGDLRRALIEAADRDFAVIGVKEPAPRPACSTVEGGRRW